MVKALIYGAGVFVSAMTICAALAVIGSFFGGSLL